MTDAITGTLTDYDLMTEGQFQGFYGARIDDKPYVVMHHVDSFLLRLSKGESVEALLNKDGHISKIQRRKSAPAKTAETPRPKEEIDKERQDYNAKAKSYGFGEPTPGPVKTEAQTTTAKENAEGDQRMADNAAYLKGLTAGKKQETCTSPEKPAEKPAGNPGIKTVEGQIVELDKPAHKITLKDKAGQRHAFIWGPALDAEFSKLNLWWFCKVTGEYEPDVDLWRATTQGFFKRPEDWPVAPNKSGQGGRSFVPRNEKPMLYESVFKTLGEMFDPEKDGKGKTFEENARRVWAMTEEIGDKMAAKSGVQ